MQLDKVVYFILGVVNIFHLSPFPSYITIFQIANCIELYFKNSYI